MSIEKQIITKAVEQQLPLYLRNMRWYILEQREESRDELHCFDLFATTSEDGQPVQKIVHTYKIPAYQNEHLYPDKAPIKTSIVIKVEGSGAQIMMFEDELEIKVKND